MNDSKKRTQPGLRHYQPRIEGLDAIGHFLGVSPDTVQRRIRDAALPVDRDENGRLWSTDVDLYLWTLAQRKKANADRPLVLLRAGVAHDMAIALGFTKGDDALELAAATLAIADRAAKDFFAEVVNATSKDTVMLPRGDMLAKDLANAASEGKQQFVDSFNSTSTEFEIVPRAPAEYGPTDVSVVVAGRKPSRRRARR